MTNITQAILALAPEAQVSVNAEDIDQITWYDGNPTKITHSQIIAKQAELQAEYNAQAYARSREAEYPPLEDQLDHIYHNGVESWKTNMVKPVKDKYPKPG